MREIRFARLIVEQINLGPRIVDHDQIIQPIAIEVRHVQLANLVVDGKFFRAGEAEAIRRRALGQAGEHTAHRGRENGPAAQPLSV